MTSKAPYKGALETLYTAPPTGSVVICLDEMGPQASKSYPGQRLIVPFRRVPPCDGTGKLNHGACPYVYPYGSPYDYPTR